jgi:hypothetical protein
VTLQRLPRRRLVDWTPDQGDGDAWLARLEAEGWVPEHRTGADVVINGRPVRRFAMIRREHDESGPPLE